MRERVGQQLFLNKWMTHTIYAHAQALSFSSVNCYIFLSFFVFLPSIQPRVQKNYSAIHRRRRDTNEMEIIEKGVLNREIDF